MFETSSKVTGINIERVESEIVPVTLFDEDGDEVETEDLMKKATIMFNDGSKICLQCHLEDCDDVLDAFCISDGCRYCEVYNASGKKVKVAEFHSKLLPQFIKRVWRSHKGRKQDE